jgi:acetyl-CoA carboxylase biotin carboxyl carrier protein
MAEHRVESEVTGNVWKVLVAPGDSVAIGDDLIILESMKMEIPVESPIDGRVSDVHVAVEDAVSEGQVLLVVVD